jgi:CRP/FNR family transcriptional regulator
LLARSFAPGEVIFRQGEGSQREAYLVHEGTVEVRRQSATGKRLLRTLGKGDLLGEVALFGDAPHSGTAMALERVTLLVVPAGRLDRIVRTKPNLALALIRQLARMASMEDGQAAR